MGRFCIKQFYDSWKVAKRKKYTFYGASIFLKDFIAKNNLKKYNIIGIIDLDVKKIGKEILGYKIFSIDEAFKNKAKVVFTIENGNEARYKKLYNELKSSHSENILLPNPFVEQKIARYATNKVYLVDKMQNRYQVSFVPGLYINFTGTDSVIEIGCDPMPTFASSKITITGSNAKVKIGSSKYTIRSLEAWLDGNSPQLTIGDNFSSEQVSVAIYNTPNNWVNIGNDCMFSREIVIRTSDAHSVMDKTTHKRINIDGNIVIGDNVWLTQRVIVLKNSVIPNDCIVGAHSIINKKYYKKNVILAGAPARTVKENIEWKRSLIPD